jgi:hypothetical protein
MGMLKLKELFKQNGNIYSPPNIREVKPIKPMNK